ncbi:unnamed protein product [Wuchereria bancrofti]|uniref:GH18 domain-containing protein n=1 Tax=Wuchereria bancrofti TaxID=6293 RepID=A0A3P7FZD3_WUCBA|nr:unnamed protein product [Wuchereria bancrofti]
MFVDVTTLTGLSTEKPLIAMIIIKREETIYIIISICRSNMHFHLKGEGKFLPENIPNGLCTHILYAFAKVDELGDSKAFEWNDEDSEWSKGMYSGVTKLKETNPELKILLSYGGYNFGSAIFTVSFCFPLSSIF